MEETTKKQYIPTRVPEKGRTMTVKSSILETQSCAFDICNKY